MAKVNSPSKLYTSMESKFVEAGYNDGFYKVHETT